MLYYYYYYTTYMFFTFANSRRVTRVSSHLRSIGIRVNIEIATNAISLLDGWINYESKRMIRSKVRVRDYVRILEIFACAASFHRLNHRYEELELRWPNC